MPPVAQQRMQGPQDVTLLVTAFNHNVPPPAAGLNRVSNGYYWEGVMRGKHCITLRGCPSADETTPGGGNVPLTYLSTTRRCRSETEAQVVRSLCLPSLCLPRNVPQQSTCGPPLPSLSCFVRIQRDGPDCLLSSIVSCLSNNYSEFAYSVVQVRYSR